MQLLLQSCQSNLLTTEESAGEAGPMLRRHEVVALFVGVEFSHNVVGFGHVQPVRPMRQSFLVLHRILPVIEMTGVFCDFEI